MKDSAVLVVCILVACAVGWLTQPKSEVAGESYTATSFDFEEIQTDKTDDFLRIDYDDGRIVGMRIMAISAVAYYPQKWADLQSLPSPYLEFLVGGRTYRVDLPDQEAMKLREMIFEPSSKQREE